MSHVNYRRKNKDRPSLRHGKYDYNNGYAPGLGKSGYLDKSMHGWYSYSELADIIAGGHVSNDFTNGHRGMAKSVKGAKKFARTRIRFHENQTTRKMSINYKEEQ